MQKAPSQLGTTTYKEHIDKYVELIDNDYICFDSYPFTGPFDGYLENLDIVGAACRTSGRDMWVIIQTGAWKADAILAEFQIRWQAYLCLAYGTKIIMHASYSPGWWNESTSCVNKAGEQNVTYGYVQKVNAELHALSDVFMQYDNIGVYPCGNIPVPGLAAWPSNSKAKIARKSAAAEARGTCSARGYRGRRRSDRGLLQAKGWPRLRSHAGQRTGPVGRCRCRERPPELAGRRLCPGVKTPLGKGLKLESGEGVFITVDAGATLRRSEMSPGHCFERHTLHTLREPMNRRRWTGLGTATVTRLSHGETVTPRTNSLA